METKSFPQYPSSMYLKGVSIANRSVFDIIDVRVCISGHAFTIFPVRFSLGDTYDADDLRDF